MIYGVFTSVLLKLYSNDILSVYKCVNYDNKWYMEWFTSVLTITTNGILSVYKCVNYNNKWYIECLQVC